MKDTLPQNIDAAVTEVVMEVLRARAKHGASGRTIEDDVTQDRRLRILTEEVGEVAAAIEDHEQALELKQREGMTCDTQTLEELRETVRRKKAHLREEITQVAAAALRWLAVEIGDDPGTVTFRATPGERVLVDGVALK